VGPSLHHLRKAQDTATNENGCTPNHTSTGTGRLERGRTRAIPSDKGRQSLSLDHARLCFLHWGIAVPIPDTKASTMSRTIFRHILCNHGRPRVILTDRGKELIGNAVNHLCKTVEHQKDRDNGRATSIEPCRAIPSLPEFINDGPTRLIWTRLGPLRGRSSLYIPCVILRGIGAQPILHALRTRSNQTTGHTAGWRSAQRL
jgi:hypothetical protein